MSERELRRSPTGSTAETLPVGATSPFEGLVAEAATRPQMARKTSKAFIAGALLRQSSERPEGSALASAAPCLRFCQATSFVMKGKERKSDEGAAEPTCKSGSVSRSAESAESCATSTLACMDLHLTSSFLPYTSQMSFCKALAYLLACPTYYAMHFVALWLMEPR